MILFTCCRIWFANEYSILFPQIYHASNVHKQNPFEIVNKAFLRPKSLKITITDPQERLQLKNEPKTGISFLKIHTNAQLTWQKVKFPNKEMQTKYKILFCLLN